MANVSLFPMFMNPLGGGGSGAGGDGLIVELLAEPDIVLEPEVEIELSEPIISLVLEEDIEIEVE